MAFTFYTSLSTHRQSYLRLTSTHYDISSEGCVFGRTVLPPLYSLLNHNGLRYITSSCCAALPALYRRLRALRVVCVHLWRARISNPTEARYLPSSGSAEVRRSWTTKPDVNTNPIISVLRVPAPHEQDASTVGGATYQRFRAYDECVYYGFYFPLNDANRVPSSLSDVDANCNFRLLLRTHRERTLKTCSLF